MTEPENEQPTTRERRIIELEDLIEGSSDAAQIAQWEHELEEISLMSDETYEARQNKGRPG